MSESIVFDDIAHRCTIFLCHLDLEIDDRQRHPNINIRDHLVGRLTTPLSKITFSITYSKMHCKVLVVNVAMTKNR